MATKIDGLGTDNLMMRIRVNSYEQRKTIAAALIEEGYTIRLEKRERMFNYHEIDYFIIIVSQPNFPEYKKPSILP